MCVFVYRFLPLAWLLAPAECCFLDTTPCMCAESGCTRRPRKLRPQRWGPATQHGRKQPRTRAVRLWRVAQCGPGRCCPQAWAHHHWSCGAARDQPGRGSWRSHPGDDGAHPAEAGRVGHPHSCCLAGPAGSAAAGSCCCCQRGAATTCTSPSCCCCWPRTRAPAHQPAAAPSTTCRGRSHPAGPTPTVAAAAAAGRSPGTG